jgi:hypothetical protein
VYIHLHHFHAYSRFIKAQFAFAEMSTARDERRAASGERRAASIRVGYKEIEQQDKRRVYLGGRSPNARAYRRSVKAPIADYHVPVATQESHQFFFLSLAISRASTAALSIVATCETLGFYALSRQILRAEIDIWSRTSCSPCARYTHTQFVDIKSEDDLTLTDVCLCTREREESDNFCLQRRLVS